ncbi:hypothetical protein [Kerstersia sp.]|uniref:hypothetical protein n=1 Tax=Kerstersia sp. TaxID=1930783 RepID=UPI003F938133
MKTLLLAASGLACLLTAAPALAKDTACMIEGSFNLMGQTIKSRDCMQADPAEREAAFKSSCEQLANTSAAMGGAAGKITYMAQCTTPAQGVCHGLAGTQRDAYYYERNADDLAALPASCAQLGGRWSNGH